MYYAKKTQMKILLVDDDLDDCLLFSEAIRAIDPGICCEIAHRAEAALNKLITKADRPDIIFLDVNMPVMDGRECLRHVKSISTLSNIPVVACSTSNDERDISYFQSYGAGYIVKPSRFEVLVDELKAYILPVLQQQYSISE